MFSLFISKLSFCPLWGKISLICSDKNHFGPLPSFCIWQTSIPWRDFVTFYRWSYGDIRSKNRDSEMLLCSACDANTKLLRIRDLQRILSLKHWRMLGRSKRIIHFPIKQSCLTYVISSVCTLEYFCSMVLWESWGFFLLLRHFIILH